MRNRSVFFLALLVAVAVFSGLVGVIIGRSAGNRGKQLMEQTGEAPIAGLDIGHRRTQKIRIWEGPNNNGPLAFEIVGNPDDLRRAYVGIENRGVVAFAIQTRRNGARIHAGPNDNAEAKFTLQNGVAYAGPNDNAPAAWSLCGRRNICLGRGSATPKIYTIEGKRFYVGPNDNSTAVLTANIDLDDPVIRLILPILFERLFEQWGDQHRSQQVVPLPASGEYGNIPGGDRSYKNGVSFSFEGQTGDVTIQFEAFDIDFDGEVAIYLNGTLIGHVPSSSGAVSSVQGAEIDEATPLSNAAWTYHTVTLPDAVVNNDETNILTFDNTRNPPYTWWWGVRAVHTS